MNSVTAYISTKDRYFTTLPLAIVSIANQTVKPNKLVIIDDGEHKDLRSDSLYTHIYHLLQKSGIDWSVIFGKRIGQVANHQLMLETATTDWIWRMDDDDVAEPNVLETLLHHTSDPTLGAVGGLVLIPTEDTFGPEECSGTIADLSIKPNYQWSRLRDIQEVDHLHNTFLYRKAAASPYPVQLSMIGHREETIFTYQIKRKGFRVIIDPNATTWHFRSPSGGIRSFSDAALWEQDEATFNQLLKQWNIEPVANKLVVLNGGIGDHLVFKMILPEMKAKYGNNLTLATSYPGVFEDSGVKQISIAEALKIDPNHIKYDIYAFCAALKWTGSIKDAYRKMYL